MPLYRGLNKEQIDKLYNNTGACKDWAGLYGDMKTRSAAFYETARVERDIPYSTSARTKFDFIDSGIENAPTYIFIHGGYWQNCAKEDFAFIAEGITKAGINVILPEYTLAPEASMAQIVKEIDLFLSFLQKNAGQYKITAGKVVLSGHSAGGHLTAVHRHHPIVSHAMPISALVDLYPISLCFVNEKLKLTDDEIERYSPVRDVRDGVPTSVHNGSNELMELIRHSLSYAESLMTTNSKVAYHQTEGCDHFTQLYHFNAPDGSLLQSLKTLLAQ